MFGTWPSGGDVIIMCNLILMHAGNNSVTTLVNLSKFGCYRAYKSENKEISICHLT